MSERLPCLKADEVIRALRKAGFACSKLDVIPVLVTGIHLSASPGAH